MEVLLDTSVWIDYFRSGEQSDSVDFLIDENVVVINDLILTELLPLLIIKNEKKVINCLEKIKKYSLSPDWREIRDYQVSCLRSGSNGVGIADLLIAQNSIQHDLAIYSLDKHFKFMRDAKIAITLFE